MKSTRKLAWRQLLSDPPSAWMRLPMLTRGVGDEILRTVDADGEIDCGGEPPAVVVCRLAAAHPRERRRIAQAIDELISALFLRLDHRETGSVLCVQLPDLSLARSPSARSKRTRSQREADVNPTRSGREADAKRTRSQREADVNPTRSGPEVEANHPESFTSGPVEKRREEEKREEKIRTDAGAEEVRGLKDADELLDEAHRALIRGYQRRYEAAVQDAWMGADRSHRDVRACARWAATRGAEHVEARVEQLLTGVFADERLRDERWPWAWIAKDPARYAAGPARAPRGPRKTAFLDAGQDFSGFDDAPIGAGGAG